MGKMVGVGFPLSGYDRHVTGHTDTITGQATGHIINVDLLVGGSMNGDGHHDIHNGFPNR